MRFHSNHRQFFWLRKCTCSGNPHHKPNSLAGCHSIRIRNVSTFDFNKSIVSYGHKFQFEKKKNCDFRYNFAPAKKCKKQTLTNHTTFEFNKSDSNQIYKYFLPLPLKIFFITPDIIQDKR